MEDKKIIVQQDDHLATVIINEPKRLNALDRQMLQELDTVFDKLASDKQIRVIMLTGAGRAFVAGANIQEMSGMNHEEARAFGKKGSSVFRKIETCPQPVIAAVNGFALGGGCELALACDIRIASEKATFGQPEVGLGITPGFSGTVRLARLVGLAKAKELIFTGRVITAEEASAIGLVNRVVAPEALMEEVRSLAAAIAGQAPLAVQKSKAAINNGWDLPVSEGIELETELFAQCFGTEDQKNGMSAFLKKQKTEFNGE